MQDGAGITAANAGLDNISWNVVGHTYTPKLLSGNAFIWHALIPAETFVPPHIHPTQDEWIVMLEGELEVEMGGQTHKAKAGDTIRMPMGKPTASSTGPARRPPVSSALRRPVNSSNSSARSTA